MRLQPRFLCANVLAHRSVAVLADSAYCHDACWVQSHHPRTDLHVLYQLIKAPEQHKQLCVLSVFSWCLSNGSVFIDGICCCPACTQFSGVSQEEGKSLKRTKVILFVPS